ncbi:hypothetical protein [Nocardia sp. BMG51109]|uniref:hypothetical protein n=1 Tax=Nocardia sp. BMG51109 TaxID=1056816 RepID=UPI00046702E5|nr:hypothetical protein [Nocardia sp. BMG51109]
MPITDYMWPDDPDRDRALLIEKRAARAGFGMDRKIAEPGATGPDGFRLYDPATGYEFVRSRYLEDLEKYLIG